MLTAAGIAFLLFAASDIDDLFVLVAFFADPRYRTRQIVLGQYLGIAVLVIASLALSLISLVINPAYVGFLGLIPVAIGCKKAVQLAWGTDDDEPSHHEARLGNVMTVATVTIANGGDNIGTYTPVFASSPALKIVVSVLVFAIMTAVWIAFSHWLVRHPTLGAPVRRFGHLLTPLVLIVIGVYVMYQAGSLALILDRA